MKTIYISVVLIIACLLLCCKKDNPVNTIDDPTPTFSSVGFSWPLADSISATDSIYLEVSAYNDIYNSLIKKIQIYSDNVLSREYSSPPTGIWWAFNGMQNNSTHIVYAKAYDSLNRSAQTPSKTITVHLTPPPPQSTYSPILSVGNKWYYQYTSGTIQAFIVREIVDTTSDGWRNVSVKAIYKDTTKTSKEYWKNIEGNFYILTYLDNNHSTQYAQPIYIPTLTKDSSASNSSYYYSWKITNFVFVGKTYNTQNALIGLAYLSRGVNETTYGFSNEIGLVSTYERYGLDISITEESATLNGVQLNGVLLGDSTNTIH